MVKPLWKTARVSLNTKHTGIIWSCNPTPRLRSWEIHHLKWHVLFDFQGSTIYNSQAMEPTKMSIDRKMKCTSCIYTVEYFLAVKQKKIIILAAGWKDWEIFILSEVSQREKDKYCKIPLLESISSYQWTHLQNRNGLADWENQIMIIKIRLKGRDKLRVSD